MLVARRETGAQLVGEVGIELEIARPVVTRLVDLVAGAETREHLRATADEAFRLTLFDLVGVAAILGTGRNIERIGQADIETTGEIKIDRGLLDRKSTRLNSSH